MASRIGEIFWDEDSGIYSEEGIIDLDENDELSLEECAFMIGYISDGE